MMNAFKLLQIGTLILFISACSEDQVSELPAGSAAQTSNNDLSIKYISTCGWGSRADTLIITQDSIFFSQKHRDLSSITPIFTLKKRVALTKVWSDRLYGSLNISDFQSIQINAGALNVDGCDINLNAIKDNVAHGITVSYPDSSLANIDAFVRDLDALWIELGGILPPLRP
jgi:hypothetical protein